MDANTSIDVLVLTVARPLAVASAAMLACCLLACAVEICWVVVAGGGAWRWSIAPRVLRRIVLGLCGVTLVVAVPTAAGAVTPSSRAEGTPAYDSGHGCRTLCVPSLEGLRLPDLPISTDRGSAARSSAPPNTVVRPGDSLWTIAEDLIGTRVSDGDVARLVAAIYADNRDRIGTDPDLIFPGTRLSTPEVTR
jgi:hypothetical protein